MSTKWRPVKIYEAYIISEYSADGRWLRTVRGKTGRRDSCFRTLEAAERKAEQLNRANAANSAAGAKDGA